MYHIGDPLYRLFADSTPVAPQSPIERFHTTSRRPYSEMAAMLMVRTNPVGVELFSYVNTFFCSVVVAWAPWYKRVKRGQGENHPMVLGSFQIIRDDWGRVRSVWSTRVKSPHGHAHWAKTRSVFQIGAHPPSVNLANKQSIPNKRSALLLTLTLPYVKDFTSFVNSIVSISFQEVSVVWARNLNERALTS